nr:hypothetical protein [Tanacetum cinerariifolium]
LDYPELTIQRRSRVDPTLLNNFEMATEGNGNPPVPDLQTTEELLSGDDANKHLDKFLHVTQSIKVNGVTDDALRLYLFPHSLAHHATAGFDRLPMNSINTFEQMAKMFPEKYFPPSMVTNLRNEITNFRQRLDESLFEAWERYKLSIDQCSNHNMLPVTQIDTFYNGLTLRHRDTINVAAGGSFMKRRPKECYDLIENMTAHHNDWDTSAQRSESSSSFTSSSYLEIVALKAEMAKINKNLMKILQINQQVKAVTPSHETCGGPHSYNDCPATVGQTQNVYAAGAYQSSNSYQPQGNRNLLSYCSENYLGPPGFNQNQNKNNQNQNFQNQNKNQGNNHPHGNSQGRNQFFLGASHGPNPPHAYQAPAYQAPAYQATGYQALVHQPLILQPQVVTTTKFTSYMKANDAILKNMQTNMTSLTNSNLELKNMFGEFMKMNTTSSSGTRTLSSNTITNPKEDLKGITTRSGNAYQGPTILTTSSSLPQVVERETEVTKDTVPPTNNRSTKDVQPSCSESNQKPSIPYPSRLHDQKLHDKTNDQKEKFFQIFKDLDFNISFADALILMPKFGPTIKTFLTNKDKLYELARTPLNEHCLAVLLKKLPKKLGDPGKFLIPCDFPRMDECLALVDLGVSINLMPLSVWKKLSLPELTPTLMTIELSDRSISRPIANYYDMMANRIDVIDMACEEYSQEVFVFSDVITSSNPTSCYDLIISTSSPTLTPLGDSDFLLEEVDSFLTLKNDPTSPEVDHSYYDLEGDILLLKAFINDDPSLPPPTQGKYLPQVRKELKICETKNDKSSINEPPQVELKDLPHNLEYAFFEGDDKLPIIIAKDLSIEVKDALIRVLKSHKQAIAWKLSNIKGIDPEFCTNKILIEDDFEPAVQHQRRVNPKIHDVIKKEEFIRTCLSHFEKMLQRFKDTNLCLNWEKSQFMVKEGIVLGHKISKNEIEVDKAKVDVIAKLPHPTTVKSAVMGQRKTKHFQPIHYASKTMTDAQAHYTIIEKELLAVVYDFKKFQPYLVLSKIIVYTDHSALKYLFNKQDAKPRLLRWILLLQEFDITVRDKKGAKNLAADHLFRLENPHQSMLNKKEINETFPLETLNMVCFRGNSSTPWFTEFANYHAGNFVEAIEIRKASHNGPTGRHHGLNYTAKKGIDFMGSFPSSRGNKFGTPRAIKSNRDTYFCNDQIAKVMLKYDVTHHLATTYHPQTSGQVEVYRGLKRILERTVGENHASWSDKLDDAL